MNILLIPALEKDRSFFIRTHHLAYRTVVEGMFGWDEDRQNAFANADFDEGHPYLIHYQGNAVGILGWQEKSDHIWLESFFILPDLQNKGIGRFLLQQFIDKADAKNLPLRLQTLRRNDRAQKLYLGLGFKITASDDVYCQLEYITAPR